jgi:hypothetical protein
MKGRTRRSGIRSDDVLEMASDVCIGRAVQRGLGEAAFDHLGSGEDRRPRPTTEDTGLTSTSRTARCGPACRVVRQGRRVKSPPYADCCGERRLSGSSFQPLAIRAFCQYTCSVELRARGLFLKEKDPRHPAFALQQLAKCYSSQIYFSEICSCNSAKQNSALPAGHNC